MSIATSEKVAISSASKLSVSGHWATFRSWLFCWEIYFIAFFAAFLRLYRFNTTEFEADEANYFQMAHYAVTHGLIPATSNVSSIGYYNPPASVDIFMLPVAFTNDPLWVARSVGILMTISVLLTYGFVRCYYGRVAATIAALMYATLFRTVVYSRSIWNTNLLPLFAVLFMMALFWGVVARRKGWLFPALFLLGVLIQLHVTGLLMIIPLGVALLLAPGTLRLRDLALGLLSIFIFYLPYLLWEMYSNFFDISIIVQAFLHPQQKAVFDDQAWLLYQILFNPYPILSTQNPFHWLENIVPYLDESSMLWQLSPYLAWASQLLIYLIVTSMVIILGLAVWSWSSSSTNTDSNSQGEHRELNDGSLAVGKTYFSHVWKQIRNYWSQLRNSPYRCGLLVLFCWQVVPLIVLSYHSLPLYLHYFVFLIPGPFILVGIVLTRAIGWLRDPRKMVIPDYIRRYGSYIIVVGLLVIAQFLAGLLDTSNSYNSTAVVSSPLWQIIAVNLLMIGMISLIYGFMHRYYGRAIAALAVLMYAVSFQAFLYSPGQSSQDLLPFFIVLLVMILFGGIVGGNKGWLFPALFLLGILIQLYPIIALMIVPLGIILRFVSDTLRWRDFAFGLLSLLIVYLPKLLGNISLVIASMVTTLVLVFWSWNSLRANIDSKTGEAATGSNDQSGCDKLSDGSAPKGIAWYALRNFLSRCGPLVLLCWQWVPLTILLRSSSSLSQQYLAFFLLPASCVLTSIFLGKTDDRLKSRKWKALVRYLRHYGIYALAGLVIIAQFIGSTVGIIDIDLGHYSNGLDPSFPSYDLSSLRTAVAEADHLAQRDHLNRVYISTDYSTQDQLQLLSTQMHTPVTLFDSLCIPLPSVAEGPAVMLIGPYDSWVRNVVAEFATMTLESTIGKSLLLGGSPFWLYVIAPKPEQAASDAQLSSKDHLQSGNTGQYYNEYPWLVTRWSMVDSAPPGYRTDYVYTMKQVSPFPGSDYATTRCSFTATRAGDQVLIAFDQGNLPKDNYDEATSLTISVEESYQKEEPITMNYGPFKFLTFATTKKLSGQGN